MCQVWFKCKPSTYLWFVETLYPGDWAGFDIWLELGRWLAFVSLQLATILLLTVG